MVVIAVHLKRIRNDIHNKLVSCHFNNDVSKVFNAETNPRKRYLLAIILKKALAEVSCV